MSYCRWGFGGDLYIFEGCDGDFFCMSCQLCAWVPGEPTLSPDFISSSAITMAAHVQKHELAGHWVKDGVKEALIEEWRRTR